jgi:hypothetical protein
MHQDYCLKFSFPIMIEELLTSVNYHEFTT